MVPFIRAVACLAFFFFGSSGAAPLPDPQDQDNINSSFQFQPYITSLPIPPTIDMTSGGHFNLTIGVSHSHCFGGGLNVTSTIYGYALDGQTPTFPGPTLLAKSGVPVSVQWTNTLASPHLLSNHVEPTLISHAASCYPDCGVPAVTHVHGLEVSPAYDGSPLSSIGVGESVIYKYPNSQPAGTLVYHDHAAGFTRLNAWAGLMGAYIIVDDMSEKMNLQPKWCDVPLILNDRIVDPVDGTFGYPDSEATIGPHTNWAPEAYGTVNLVNGVVAPYMELSQEQCRLRFINTANARPYLLSTDIMFEYCSIISKDAANVRSPADVSGDGLRLYPFERIDLLCDFTKAPIGSTFDIINNDQTVPAGMSEVLQVRITSASSHPVRPIPSRTNTFPALKSLYMANPGKTRIITLNELDDANNVPTILNVADNNTVIPFMHVPSGGPGLSCDLGMVEKWVFHNPTPDFHPFHWHVVRVQCGTDEHSTNYNVLEDVVPIPNAENEPDTVTQVCYVACVPSNFLVDPTTSRTDFGFSVKDPYLSHCHILEHEENDMMTFFYIRDPQDSNEDATQTHGHHKHADTQEYAYDIM